MKVPTYAPQQQAANLPTPQQSASAPKGAFGETIGAGLADAAFVMQRAQEDADMLRAQDAVNKMQEYQLDLTINPEKGFTTVKGKNVLMPREGGKSLSTDYLSQFDQFGSELESGLTNERQRALFRQKRAQAALNFRSDLAKHESREITAYNKEVTTATIALQGEEAARHWNDPTRVAQSVEQLSEAVRVQATRDGTPAPMVQALLLENKSKAYAGVIAAAADAGNVELARTYLEKHDSDLTQPHRERLKKIVDIGEFEKRTQNLADELWSRHGGNTVTILAEARKNLSGKDEDAVVTRIKTLDGERVTLRERDQKDAADIGWKLYSTKGIGAIPASVWERMDGRDMEAIKTRAKVEANSGGSMKTDIGKWLEFTNLTPKEMASMTPQELMRDFGPHFSTADLRNADNMMRAARGKGGPGEAEGLQLMTATDIVKRSARELGILPVSGDKLSVDQQAAYANYADRLQVKVNAWESANGKKATAEVLRQIVNQEKMDKVKLDEWGRDPERAVVSLSADDMKRAYVVVGKQEVKLASIPATYRISAIARRRAAGLPVSEESIATMWLADGRPPK